MSLFGWCRGIEDAALLQRHGFNYIECALASLQLENKAKHLEILPRYLESPLPVYAFNVFFPADMKLVGPQVDETRVRNYVAAAAEALQRIGARIAVLGSGGSRKVPDEWEVSRAEEQLLVLLEWIADEFTGTDITLAIEPLNTKESNIINSVSEGVKFAKQVNRPMIRVLADFYHMDEENEPLHTLVGHQDWLAHIHLADTGRMSPGTGKYPYEAFAAELGKAGYKGMISAECGVNDPETDMPASLDYMKRLFS